MADKCADFSWKKQLTTAMELYWTKNLRKVIFWPKHTLSIQWVVWAQCTVAIVPNCLYTTKPLRFHNVIEITNFILVNRYICTYTQSLFLVMCHVLHKTPNKSNTRSSGKKTNKHITKQHQEQLRALLQIMVTAHDSTLLTGSSYECFMLFGIYCLHRNGQSMKLQWLLF